MAKLGNYTPKLEGSNIIGKGDSGSGKSVAAYSFPNVFVFDLDNRVQSVVSYYTRINRLDVIKSVEYETIVGQGSILKMMQMLGSFVNRCPYQTIVIDTLTSLADATLNHAIRMRGGEGGKKIAGIDTNTIEDYGVENSVVMDIIQVFQSLKNVTCILNAHVLTVEEKQLNGATSISRSLLTGGKKVAAKIPGYFGETWHFDTKSNMKGTRYLVRTQHAGADFAKTSLILPSEIDWTNKVFYEELQSALKAPITE